MDTMKRKSQQRYRRAQRTRSRIIGTAERPRLSVHRSLKYVRAQLIDDRAGKTVCAAYDADMDSGVKKGVERARAVGKALAEKAKTAGITKAVFDRGPYEYHGQVKAIAEGAREGGLKF